MQARRAARELALILFSQFDKEITKYSRKDFEDIMLKSVRILSNSASEELNLTVGSLIDIKESLDSYEAEHETNLSRPMGAKNKPVQIPMTDEMIAKVDTMLDVAEKALLALEIAEFATLENQSEVKNYTIEIAEQFKMNHKSIDEEIQKYYDENVFGEYYLYNRNKNDFLFSDRIIYTKDVTVFKDDFSTSII